MIEVAKATVNSNMLPHGPRPTSRPRITRYASSVAKPTQAMPAAARPSGVGAMPSGVADGSRPADAARASANDPVTAPAQAGWALERLRASDSERRPLARSTACPTWAANAIASATTPIGKRIVATMFISASGDRGAAGRRAVGRDDHRPGLEIERQAAVATGRDAGGPDDVALRAADEEIGPVDVAAERAHRIDQAVAGAVGVARGHDRTPEMVARRDLRALVEADLHAWFRDAVAEPGEEREAEQRTDDPDQDEHRHQGDQPGPVGDDELRDEAQEVRPHVRDLVDDAHRRILAVFRGALAVAGLLRCAPAGRPG